MELPLQFTDDTHIREFFAQPDNKFYYINYKEFCHIFPIDKDYVNKINRGIVDMHLRFHNHVFQQMAPYKWTPIAIFALSKVIRLRSPPILIPIIWLNLFDYYFYDYFAWVEREKHIINIQDSFDFKLSKPSNIDKKLKIANNYLRTVSVGTRTEPPAKYLAFGRNSPYLYSSNEIDKEESQIYLTNLFSYYIRLINFKLGDIRRIFSDVSGHLSNYKVFMREWRKSKGKQTKYKGDYQELLKLRAVNPLKVAGFWPLLEEQINNFVEVWKYQQTNTFEKKKPFTFKMFYEIKQDIKPIDTVYKYKLQTNWQGLAIYYSVIALPWLAAKLLRR